jgi:hypothetical protein
MLHRLLLRITVTGNAFTFRPQSAPPRSALPASVSKGLQGTFCGAQGKAASPGRGAALGQSASRSETMEHSSAARRARLRTPHCSMDHRCYASGPLPRSINRQQPTQTDSVPAPRSLRSPPRAYFASSNLSAESARNFNPQLTPKSECNPPRKPNSGNHFPPIRTPEARTPEPISAPPPATINRIPQSGHASGPQASRPTLFHPSGFRLGGPARHVLRSPG